MPNLPKHLIAVTAVDHPDRDAWTDEHADIGAAENGLVIVGHLGREIDVYGPTDLGLCCHLYEARPDDGSAP